MTQRWCGKCQAVRGLRGSACEVCGSKIGPEWLDDTNTSLPVSPPRVDGDVVSEDMDEK